MFCGGWLKIFFSGYCQFMGKAAPPAKDGKKAL
jgi:hypothetical protein